MSEVMAETLTIMGGGGGGEREREIGGGGGFFSKDCYLDTRPRGLATP